MSAVFRVWLIIFSRLMVANSVFHIHEPNIPKVNGTSNEYYYLAPEVQKSEFSLVCDGPVLMRWKLSGLMTAMPQVNVVFHNGGYRATFKTTSPNSDATGFFTCEAHEEEHRLSNPAVSVYIYVDTNTNFNTLFELLEPAFLTPNPVIDKYIEVENTTEFKKTNCANLLIGCRLSNPKAEVILKGETYDNQIKLFLDATYDGKRGFSLKYCNNTIQAFICLSQEKEVKYNWKPLSVKLKEKRNVTDLSGLFDEIHYTKICPFHNNSFNLSCVGDSTIMFIGYENSSEVLVEEIFPRAERYTHKATLQVHQPISEDDDFTCEDTVNSQFFAIDSYDSSRKAWSYNNAGKLYTCINGVTDEGLKLTNWPCLNEVDCEVKKKLAKKASDPVLLRQDVSTHMGLVGARYAGGKVILLEPYLAGFFYCRNSLGGHMNKYFTGIDGIVYFLDHDFVPEAAIISFSSNKSTFFFGLETTMSITVNYSAYLLASWAKLYVRDELGIKLLERMSPSQGFKKLVDRSPGDLWIPITVNKFEWDFSPEPGMIEIIFCVQMLNETGQRNFTSKLSFEKGLRPKIANSEDLLVYYYGDSGSYDIKCEAEGNPIPEISWRRISPEVNTSQQVYIVQQQKLTFPAIVPEISGEYECTAFNSRHNLNDSKIFTVSTRDRPLDWKILMWIFLSGILVLCLVVSICIYYKRREGNLANAVRHLTLKEVEDFFKGAALSTQPFFRQQVDAAENAVRMPYNDVFEVDPDEILYDSSNLIGQGAFGMVFKATMRIGMKSVAVKTVHENVTTEVFKATLSELKILMYVGYHPHIVEFLGAITKDIEKLDVKLVLEYCDNGDMNQYLRSMHRIGLDFNCGSCSQDGTTKQFLKWLVGIAFGMEHLAKRKIIHGDLATRNILLNSNLDPKITDFGLSAKSVDYSAYVRKGTNEPLPWRWMALESLTRFTFSSASDVWSFGVTAWEIFSFGGTPYPNRTWDESFVQNLWDGIRLPKPQNCADEIFEEILSCWNENLELRADIFSLKIKLQKILDNMP